MNESKPQLADGVRKNEKFAQEESAMPNLPETPAGHGPWNEKRSMLETTAPIAPKTDDDSAKGNETTVQEEAAAPAAPATEAVPGQVIAFPRRDSAAGSEIIPNVVVHTVAGTAAKIVVISSGFGTIRHLDVPQSASSRSSQHIRMAA
ncbi:hypothetical protein [Paenibacillus contaminans]|uniref:Uncharacterized protein n=1 Tax=Paenibacillus contaminans TaxID=450362 RepID=A0A329MAN1_9BACL|nr:hypothetical protein [Paenibacillus contaminans]RAV16708.1 hypothetical protein DQG23_28135 [Paenibacillus contaminans]